MKKMIKLSLVAAVAVAGLTTTASAGNLADMIQGVQTNGYVRYRNTDTDSDTVGKDTNKDEYKIVLNNVIKVNDDVKANLKFVNTGEAFKVIHANFKYTKSAVSLTAGAQAYGIAFTNDAAGTGAKLQGKVGPATLIAAGFSAGENDSTTNATAYAAIVPVGPATITAMFATAEEGSGDAEIQDGQLDKGDYTYLNAKAKVANVALSATMVGFDPEKTNTDQNDVSLSFLTASTKVAGFGITLGYAQSGKDGGNIAIADGGAGDRTASQFTLIQANAGALDDATTTLVKVSKKVGPVALTIGQASTDAKAANKDQTETIIKAVYAMSKNFKVVSWVSSLDKDAANADNTKTRLELKYTF